MDNKQIVIKVTKTKDNAVIPQKAYDSDSGYDITLITYEKQMGTNLHLFGTGLCVAPDEGFYVELVARSSLMKHGYMLANNIGIIDNHYRGELFVALFKFDQSKPNLELPLRAAQIIPRKIIDAKIVYSNNLDDTERGTGGFGSTGK